MLNVVGRTASVLIALSFALSGTALAQDPPKKDAPAKTAPAKPAPPAARPAPPPAAARPAPQPHIAAPPRPAPQPRVAAPPRPAPSFNRPAPAARNANPAFERRTPAARTATPVTATPQARTASPQLQQQAQPLTRAQQRQQRVEERRALRGVPAAQRAQRLEQFRAQRAARQNPQATTPNATPNTLRGNAAVAPNTLTAQSTTRRNGAARVSAQAAQQGRFAARFAARQQSANLAASAAPAFVSARRAWRDGRRAGFRAWYGPVFYPYAYSDIFDYAFWPGGYDDGYWDYAYDDFFDGVFYGTAPIDLAYGAAPPAGEAQPSYASVQQLCKQPGNGVTAWPFAEIGQKVGLNGEQKALLDDMKAAAQMAAQAFSASCPAENAFPVTPPGRLAAMTARLDATLTAVETVKPALDKFYNALSDEQKERFNELGPSKAARAETTAAAATDKAGCGEPKPGLTNLPIERIEDAVKPTEAQENALKNLEDATAQAVATLAAACPNETPITPPGRLDAMALRLRAMVDAANTVKPALNAFYGSLNGEQKARFNAVGRSLAQNDR